VRGEEPVSAAPGREALPSLDLRGLDGALHPLSEAWAAGDAVVAVGHSDCPTTLLALPFLDRLHRRRARVLLVLQDKAEAARGLVSRFGLGMPVRLEADPYPLARALDLLCVPTLLLVGEGGRIERAVEGYSRVELLALAERLGVVDPPLLGADDDAPAFRPG